MSRFAVAYISFFDNEMRMSIVEAESDADACRMVLRGNVEEMSDEFRQRFEAMDAEELAQWAFNWDSMIGAIEV